MARVGNLRFGVDRATGFTLGNHEALGSAFSPGLPMGLLTLFKLLPYPEEFSLERIASDPVSE
jgi:hypothetical protein